MGLIRSIAKRALAKVTGAEAGPAAASPPVVATPPAPPVVATPPAPPVAAAASRPPNSPTAASLPPNSPTAAPAATQARGPTAEELAAAEALSRLLAGAQEVKERMEAGEPVFLIDVRDAFETAAGVIPGALLLPLSQLPTRWREVADANEVICYCATGIRSLQAATLLRDKGVFNATSLDGGITQWLTIGGRIVRPG